MKNSKLHGFKVHFEYEDGAKQFNPSKSSQKRPGRRLLDISRRSQPALTARFTIRLRKISSAVIDSLAERTLQRYQKYIENGEQSRYHYPYWFPYQSAPQYIVSHKERQTKIK